MNAATVLNAARSGPAYLIEGYRLLLQPGLRRFVVLPIIGNVLLFALASLLAFAGLEWAIERWLPNSFEWLRWLLFPLLAIGLVFGSLFLFTLVANLLLGPFLGSLANAVAQRQGWTPSSQDQHWWASIRRELSRELKRLAYVLACLLAVAVISLIPLLNLLAAPIGVLVSAWLLSLEFSAHALGLQSASLGEQLQLLRSHRGSALSFGLTALAAMLVPVLNLLVLPAAVAGMTLWVVDRSRDK